MDQAREMDGTEMLAPRSKEGQLHVGEDQLRAMHERLESALAAGDISTWTWDLVNERIVADASLSRLFSLSPQDAAGGRREAYLKAIHPEDRPRVARIINDAVASKTNYEAEYRVVLPDGSFRWLIARGKVQQDDAGRAVSLPGVVVDITSRKLQQEALRESLELLREQGEFLQRLLESSEDCIMTLDLDGRLLSMTDLGQEVMQVDDFASLRGVAWVALWEGETRDRVDAAIETARQGATGRFQGVCRTMRGTPKWWDAVVTSISDEDGLPEQLLVVARDITEQKSGEERELIRTEREKTRLTEIIMQAPAFMAVLRGPEHVFEIANPSYLQLVGHRDIIGKPVALALPEVLEQGFVALLDRVYRTGKAFVGQDIRIMIQSEPDGPLEECFLDFTYQPLLGDDGNVTGILAHGIDRTERKRLEQEREHLLEQARTLAAREALLNKIGAAVRSSLEPEEILEAAVSALGQGLGADRCYFVRYDKAQDTARVSSEWFREGAAGEPLKGQVLQPSFYSINRDAAYLSGRTHVINDVAAYAPEDAAALLALNVRALLRVPIEAGNHMTALAVSMAHEPRQWTDDEVRLVENVAALLHATLAAARVQYRERNIARQLQDALLPPPPSHLPGLMMATHYQAALEVGGDIIDIYDLDENCTALVVADLSGKGLEAASEVGVVRNMLRYALYTETHVVTAVSNLHDALVEHDLLTAFATLFVGAYDHKAKTLTYVNCGQEPGLLWKAATNVVVELAPTGAVLGAFGTHGYSQETAALAEGDVVVLFTDGLSEVGPTRNEFLETAGVSKILRDCCAAHAKQKITPQFVLEHLIAEVNAFARGGVRDDIALLVGVVTG